MGEKIEQKKTYSWTAFGLLAFIAPFFSLFAKHDEWDIIPWLFLAVPLFFICWILAAIFFVIGEEVKYKNNPSAVKKVSVKTILISLAVLGLALWAFSIWLD